MLRATQVIKGSRASHDKTHVVVNTVVHPEPQSQQQIQSIHSPHQLFNLYKKNDVYPATTLESEAVSLDPCTKIHSNNYDTLVMSQSTPFLADVSPARAFKAIKKNDIKMLSKLCDYGLDANSVDSHGVSLLHTAVSELKPDIVEILLKNGANPNMASPLKRNISLLPVYYSATNPDENSSCMCFDLKYLSPLMSLILKIGENKNFTKPKISHSPFFGIKNSNSKNNKIEPDLNADEEKILSSLLKYGADVNFKDPQYTITPTFLASNYAMPEILKKLTYHGAEFNVTCFKTLNPFGNPARYKFDPLNVILSQSKFSEKAQICLNVLYESGADLHALHSSYIKLIFSHLAAVNPKNAASFYFEHISLAAKKMDRNRVYSIIREFLRANPKDDKGFDYFTELLLHKDLDLGSKYSAYKHFAHMKSWDKTILLDSKKNKTLVEDEIINSEGWDPQAVAPQKIKALLKALQEISNNRVDCVENFGFPRDIAISNLRDEIFAQTTTFFTANLETTFTSFETELNPFLFHQANRAVNIMCDCISELKPGQSFASYAGCPGHAFYIDYRKQENGNITRSIFNLGNGSQYHPVDENNRILPHQVIDIPSEHFEKRTPVAINFLVNAFRSPHDMHSFQNLYDHIPFGRLQDNTEGIPSSKPQVVGNCSYKNNNAAEKFRIGKELLKFVKSIEQKDIEKIIQIPHKLLSDLEISNGINSMLVIVDIADSNPRIMELEMYNYFKKRCDILPSGIIDKPGVRLAATLLNKNNRKILEATVDANPFFVKFIKDIAIEFKNKKLHGLANKLHREYVVTSLSSLKSELQSKFHVQLKPVSRHMKSTVHNLKFKSNDEGKINTKDMER